jgi:hypothetical protein
MGYLIGFLAIVAIGAYVGSTNHSLPIWTTTIIWALVIVFAIAALVIIVAIAALYNPVFRRNSRSTEYDFSAEDDAKIYVCKNCAQHMVGDKDYMGWSRYNPTLRRHGAHCPVCGVTMTTGGNFGATQISVDGTNSSEVEAVAASLLKKVAETASQPLWTDNSVSQIDNSDPVWDVFISHASEDKADVARPLASALTTAGFKVWIDDNELSLGDSLSKKIDHGLAKSRYGVVILSESFFRKAWPTHELAGLVARQAGAQKVILPVWHQVNRDFVMKYSPTLADALAVSTDQGLTTVAQAIMKILEGSGRTVR